MAFAALAIAIMALCFTVASFWWVHARPGHLRSFAPTTWAAYLNRDRSALRLPLVLHNTGAVALVVLELRVRFAEGGEVMAWEWTRTRVRPTADDLQDVPAPFSVAARDTHELVAEFVGSFPGVVPEQRAHPVVVEARTSLGGGWRTAVAFDLELGNLIHPSDYIVYSNDASHLTEEELSAGATELAQLRNQWGLTSERSTG